MNADSRARTLVMARTALERSYVPYSGFRMGAAVMTEREVLLPGALVENVSLGLAMCAERVALFTAVAQDAGRPVLLALVSRRTDGRLTFPCGACLQVALELGGPDLQLVAADPDGVMETALLRDLGPQLPRKVHRDPQTPGSRR
jgi:cytidine deaminase